jgi:hypothetical protein
VAVYVEATNGFDLERWMAAFAHDALVNVELQAYWEKPASSECAKRDIIGGETDDECSYSDQPLGNLIMAARVDGDCDERGLSDPLALAFYVGPQSGLIFQLIIFCNRSDI